MMKNSSHPDGYINSIRHVICIYAKKQLLILIIILYFSQVYCQEKDQATAITEIAEQLAADSPDPESAELFTEQLNELSDDPVRINNANESELSRLFFLSEFQIKAIIDHILHSGAIVSIYEIASIPGFDREIVELMLPFITLEGINPERSINSKVHNTSLTNLIIRPGEKDSLSPGSQLKFLTKYKLVSGCLSSGVTVEKDAGEKLISGKPLLPDFLSGYFSFTGKGFIKKVILGDYSVSFGMGTNLNTSMHTGLSVSYPAYMQVRNEIKSYTSSDENNYFRGAAAVIGTGNLDLSLLVSYNKIDASLASDSDTAEPRIISFYKSGLHNSASSVLKKDAVDEALCAVNVIYRLPSARFGFTLSGNRFSIPVAPSLNNPEHIFAFSGSKNMVGSIYYNTIFDKIFLSGEISTDRDHDIALVNTISVRPDDRFSASLIYRNYSKGFDSFHGRGPGSGTGNETGIFGSFTFEAAKYFFVICGCDIEWFPWLRYRTSFPSMARREEIKLRYIPGDTFTLEGSYQFRYTMVNDENEQGLPGVGVISYETFKGVMKYTPEERVVLTTRIDYKIMKHSGMRGMILQQDIKYRFRVIPLTLWFRNSIYRTDDWDSRIYTFENDLLYSFSIPAFSGKGTRVYLMAEWEIGDFAALRIKYGITSVLKEDLSAEETDELKFQFRLLF